MNDSSLLIPHKIRVGFQNRSDTYTKKLGYVIYYDAKNKIHKEKSFESWRDKKIDTQEFDNVPTSGFVINKKVGDYKGSWFDSRMAMVRIYDPRDFEFEITVDNLLLILNYNNSIIGKGLEGEFVYSWEKGDLYLLPVVSKEYIAASTFTKLQTKKVNSKELVPGKVYKFKNNKKSVYLGRLNYKKIGEGSYSMNVDANEFKNLLAEKPEKRHCFYNIDGKEELKNISKIRFEWPSSLSNVAEEIDEIDNIKLSDLLEFYFNNVVHSGLMLDSLFNIEVSTIGKIEPKQSWLGNKYYFEEKIYHYNNKPYIHTEIYSFENTNKKYFYFKIKTDSFSRYKIIDFKVAYIVNFDEHGFPIYTDEEVKDFDFTSINQKTNLFRWNVKLSFGKITSNYENVFIGKKFLLETE
jgi:hypothetical protein